jgi:hypothetical protein
MESRIQDVTQYYAKFQNILPEGLLDSNKNNNIKITEEVEKAKNEINNIIEEDSKNIKNLAAKENKIISFNDFSRQDFVTKMAFYRRCVNLQDNVLFYYAQVS